MLVIGYCSRKKQCIYFFILFINTLFESVLICSIKFAIYGCFVFTLFARLYVDAYYLKILG